MMTNLNYANAINDISFPQKKTKWLLTSVK